MSFSNYEQTVIIDSVALSGVIDVNGSYGISERPIKAAGVGFIDALVENFESDAEETISSLEMNVLELERELVEVEIQNRSLRKELSDREGTLV